MERFVTDERTGLKHELVGDYYLIAGDDEPEEDQPIGIWGQRHLRHLKRHHKVIYACKAHPHPEYSSPRIHDGRSLQRQEIRLPLPASG